MNATPYGKEMVNHPSHYQQCSFECIDAMRIAFGPISTMMHCVMSAYEYLHRHKFKNGLQDIQKALKFLEFAQKISERNELVLPVQYDELKHLCEDILSEAVNKQPDKSEILKTEAYDYIKPISVKAEASIIECDKCQNFNRNGYCKYYKKETIIAIIDCATDRFKNYSVKE